MIQKTMFRDINESSLIQKFLKIAMNPCFNIYTHPGFCESTDAPVTATVPDAAAVNGLAHTLAGARKSRWAKKPNVRIAAPEWA
jgi:hypothetical protein